jgi:hypothetical protein
MKWIITLLVVAAMANSAQAVLVSPNHFSESLDHGSNYTNHFRITPEGLSEDITVSWSSPFGIQINETLFNLSTYHDLDFYMEIPESFLQGNYQSYIFVHGVNDTKIVAIDVEVRGDSVFEVGDNVTITARTGTQQFFLVPIRNTGNEIITLSFNTSIGIGELTPATSSIKTYPKTSMEIPFILDVDVETAPDTFLANIYVHGANQTKTVPVHVTVQDGISPQITDMGIRGNEGDDIEAGVEHIFWAECSDNLNVKRIQMHIDSDDFNDTYGMASHDDAWEMEFTPEFIGETDFEMICEDDQGNMATRTFTRNVIQVQDCEISDVEFYSIKKGTTVSRPILDCVYEIPVEVSLRDFEYDPIENVNSSIFEIFLDDGIDKHNLNTNNSVILDEVDYLKIGLRANGSGFYTGKIKLDFPPWIHDDVTLDFSGKIGDLTVPETFNKYVGDGYLDCRANLTEDERTSSWVCEFIYPIATDLNQLAKPMTPERYNEIVGLCDSKMAIEEGKTAQARAEAAMYLAFLILGIVYLVVTFFIPQLSHNRNRPRVLLKMK